MRLILASASPRRRELLAQMGYEFEVIPARGEEKVRGNCPQEIVQKLACSKAEEVACSVRGDCTVIGADTIVVHRDRILGKPHDVKEAEQMLHELEDDVHHVYTGVCLLNRLGGAETREVFYEDTEVYFGAMDDAEIRRYVRGGEPLDKAGGYGIQGQGGIYIEKIIGDYYNVVGLPIHALHSHLKNIERENGKTGGRGNE